MCERAAEIGFSTKVYRRIGLLEIAGAIGLLLGSIEPLIGALAVPGCCSCWLVPCSRTCAKATARGKPLPPSCAQFSSPPTLSAFSRRRDEPSPVPGVNGGHRLPGESRSAAPGSDLTSLRAGSIR
jgi:hypothetical protein